MCVCVCVCVCVCGGEGILPLKVERDCSRVLHYVWFSVRSCPPIAVSIYHSNEMPK